MCDTFSGLYRDTATGNELRLDVDGDFPLLRASGTFATFQQSVSWMAELVEVDPTTWEGSVVFRHPAGSFLPFSSVRISVSGSTSDLGAAVDFVAPGSSQTATYAFESPFFHPVEFEYDVVAGTSAVTTIDTQAHPNRPSTLAAENLSIEDVYRRAGFDVSVSAASNDTVPISFAASSGESLENRQLWDDNELHDAMQVFWSRFDSRAQWAMWVVFASLHEADEPSIFDPNPQPEDLGGIMFDSIGAQERQGTAIFNDAFISNPPQGDPAPEAWVRRMRFWTAVHEAGHGFNLAHAWQKHLGVSWRPIASDPEVRSFMNYPFRVFGGQSAFFSDFEFRFSDQELEFLRHAPEQFVQMGNANFFDDHGFRRITQPVSDKLSLEIRVHRPVAEFEFMEPVMIELKLKSLTDDQQVVDARLLSNLEHQTIIVKKDGRPARQYKPFAQHCWRQRNVALPPGEALYHPQNLSTGLNGWDIAEPGYYTLQVALDLDDEHVLSNPLRIRVAPPHDRTEEYLAQDLFSEDVGRVLAFNGSRTLGKANDVLRTVVDRLPDRRVAIHARLALATPQTREYKELRFKDDSQEALKAAGAAGAKLVVGSVDEKGAEQLIQPALLENPHTAAESLGHIHFKSHTDRYSSLLEKVGDFSGAAHCQQTMHETFSKRGVHKTVLGAIDKRCKGYSRHKSRARKSKKSKS